MLSSILIATQSQSQSTLVIVPGWQDVTFLQKKPQVRTLEHTPLTVTVDERVCLNVCGPDAQFTEMNATTIGYPASVLIVIDC